MAHLMGLLLGMTAAKLQGMARHWLIEATVEPRTLVSQLYSQMTDEQTVKFLYESLSSRERLVLGRLLEEPKGWIPGRVLERELPFSPLDLEMVLVALDETGLISVGTARVSGNTIIEGPWLAQRPRASVQMTIVRMAPEVVSNLLRIKSQMLAGDQSDKTLHKLLGGLTLPQLQELASKWRIPHSDQCFKRELMLLLKEAISRRKCVEDTLVRLGEDSSTAFRTVCDAGGKISVDSLRESARLPDKALRAALSSLIGHLLLAETYVDGQRYLFVASGVARDDDGDLREATPCSELGSEHEVNEPRKTSPANSAFFFDLLVLTNLLETNDVELAGRDFRLPRWAVGQLKEELAVVAGNGFGPIRLDCLIRVAIKLGLITTRDERIVCTDRVAEWASLGIVGQSRALFDLWLEDDCWCTELRGYRVDLDAAKYRGIRKRILAVLRRCRPGSWYRVDTIVQAVVGKCSDIDDVVRMRAAAEVCVDAEYRDLVKRAVALSLGTLIFWTGGLSLGYEEGMEPSAISINPLGAWLCGHRATPRPNNPSGKLIVLPNFEVMLHGPDSEAWHWLLRFAVTVSVGRVSIHQITKRKVQQATARGHSADGFVRFLRERGGEKVPSPVVSAILEWAGAARHQHPGARGESLVPRLSN